MKLTEFGFAVINKTWTLSRLARSPGAALVTTPKVWSVWKEEKKNQKDFSILPPSAKAALPLFEVDAILS